MLAGEVEGRVDGAHVAGHAADADEDAGEPAPGPVGEGELAEADGGDEVDVEGGVVAGLGGRVRVVLADPQGSGLYNKVRHGVMYSSTEREGPRRRQQVDSIVEGVGVNRVTANFEAGRDMIDDAVKVTDEQACRMARWLVENDGIFVGSSSSVNCTAAVVAAMKLPPGSRVVTVLCDSGTRHLSKFWKKIKELGLEDEEATDLFAELGITP